MAKDRLVSLWELVPRLRMGSGIVSQNYADPAFSPREYGKGSRQCRVCAHRSGLIR